MRPGPRKIVIENWDPDFGHGLARDDLEPTEASVDPGVELDPQAWKPVVPVKGTSSPCRLVFVDGVRRIDALVWISEGTGGPRMGMCASYAAGVVEAASRATVRNIEVRRGLFAAFDVEPLVTEVGTYAPTTVDAATPTGLENAVQTSLRKLETEVARGVSGRDALVVVDGPLSAQHAIDSSLGYVKTHRVRYLDDRLCGTVHALSPGERTPLFVTTTAWKRYSSYLRLPGRMAHPWAGIVRLEVAAQRPFDEATKLVNAACLALPRYASIPYKEPRAPQNLFPVGGLERELKRRLGDPYLVVRSLRAAAAART